MKIHLLFASIVTIIVLACGVGKPLDNPADPECSTASTADSSSTDTSTSDCFGGTVSTTTSSTGEVTTVTETSTNVGGGITTKTSTSTSTSGSTTPAVSFNFNSNKNITPSSCEVSQTQIIDVGDGILVFVLGSCSGARAQGYVAKSDYGLSSTLNYTQFTDCAQGSTGGLDFAADGSSTGALAVYQCQAQSSYSYDIKAIPISTSGTPGTAISYTNFSTNSYSIYHEHVVWNSTAQVFGMAMYGKFQRFDQNGNPVGGAVTLSNGKIVDLIVSNGSWYALSSSSSDSPYDSTYCTVLSSSGVSLANGVALSNSYAARLDSDLFSISSAGPYAINSANVSQVCARDTSSNNVDLSGSVQVRRLLNIIKLSSSFGASLFTMGTSTSSTTLNLSVFSRSDVLSIISTSSVANITSMNYAHASVINNKLFVFYDDNKSAHVAISSEEISK